MDNHTEPTPENLIEQTQTSIEEVLPENTAVTEPILEDNPNRFVLFPIEHNDIWNYYKKSEASFWTAEEIDLAADIVDWNDKLTDDERCFLDDGARAVLQKSQLSRPDLLALVRETRGHEAFGQYGLHHARSPAQVTQGVEGKRRNPPGHVARSAGRGHQCCHLGGRGWGQVDHPAVRSMEHPTTVVPVGVWAEIAALFGRCCAPSSSRPRR